MVKFKDFPMPLSVFQVISKANLFSMTFQDSPVNSSTFQACANPGFKQETMIKDRWFIAISFCLALDNILFSGATRLNVAHRDLHYYCLY